MADARKLELPPLAERAKIENFYCEGPGSRFFPLLFPKKTGEAYERALPFVREIYAAPSSGNSQVVAKLGPMRFHSFRPAARWRLVIGLFLIHVAAWPLGVMVRALVCALLYSCIESTFTLLERGAPYTSDAQFWGNLLVLPFTLELYSALVPRSAVAFIALFPLNIWLLEVVEGHAIAYVYGRNVAWCYADYSDEFYHGWLRLGHAVWWLGLGAICFVLYPILQAAAPLQVYLPAPLRLALGSSGVLCIAIFARSSNS